jgi:hypothetical protein
MNQIELLQKHKERIIEEAGHNAYLEFVRGYKRRIDLFDLLARYEAEDELQALKYQQKLKAEQAAEKKKTEAIAAPKMMIVPAKITEAREDDTGKIHVFKRPAKKKGRHK